MLSDKLVHAIDELAMDALAEAVIRAMAEIGGDGAMLSGPMWIAPDGRPCECVIAVSRQGDLLSTPHGEADAALAHDPGGLPLCRIGLERLASPEDFVRLIGKIKGGEPIAAGSLVPPMEGSASMPHAPEGSARAGGMRVWVSMPEPAGAAARQDCARALRELAEDGHMPMGPHWAASEGMSAGAKLGRALEIIADRADAVMEMPGANMDRQCRMEHECAVLYGKKTFSVQEFRGDREYFRDLKRERHG